MTRRWITWGIIGAVVAAMIGCDRQDASTPSNDDAVAAEPGDIPSLQARLDEKKAAFAQQAPAELRDTFERGVAEVRDSGVTDNMLKVGAQAPAFSLPNGENEQVELATLLQDGPVVLVWYRGGWCPYCVIQLNAYQELLPEFAKLRATVVGIAPERPVKVRETAATNNLTFTLLSDKGNRVATEYGLTYTLPEAVQAAFKGRIDFEDYNGDTSAQLPLSATFVIDADGTVRFAEADADYKKRAEPADVIAVLRDL